MALTRCASLKMKTGKRPAVQRELYRVGDFWLGGVPARMAGLSRARTFIVERRLNCSSLTAFWRQMRAPTILFHRGLCLRAASLLRDFAPMNTPYRRPIPFIPPSFNWPLRIAAALLAWTALSHACHAQLCIQLNGAAHKQPFAIGTGGGQASDLPIGFAYSESGTGNNITYAASDGASSTGNTYNFGTTGNADRALGELGDGTFKSIIGACFVNNTGLFMPSFSISYTGEMWRLGAADGINDRLDFQFSTNALSLNDEGEPGARSTGSTSIRSTSCLPTTRRRSGKKTATCPPTAPRSVPWR